MIPYEELAAALEGNNSPRAAAPQPSYASNEDPTLNSTAESTGELEIGEVLSDEEAS